MKIRPLIVAGQPITTDDISDIRSPEGDDARPAVARVCLAGHAQREQATRAAHTAFQELRRWPRHRRRDLCARIADGIVRRADELAEVIRLEAGKPIRLAQGEVARAELVFRLAAEEATRATVGEVLAGDIGPSTEAFSVVCERFARGPVIGISPFNFPLNLAAHKIAPALAAGCSIVLKPAPQAPSATLILGEIAS